MAVIRTVLISLLLLFFPWGLQANGDTPCLRVMSEELLQDLTGSTGPLTVNAGGGLSLRLSERRGEDKTPGPEPGKRQLQVKDNENTVKELPESFYWGHGRLEKGRTFYWIIGEYTGGMHCCNRYYIFTKTAKDAVARYIGVTEGSMGVIDAPLTCKGDEAYFEDSDMRFVYFHTSYAFSQLFFPRFYHLTPSTLNVENTAFKARYMKETAAVDTEIAKMLKERKARPKALPSLLSETDNFSDELAQLLIKRTILYLYAREEQKAWRTFRKDVWSHYKTTKSMVSLKKEVERILKRESILMKPERSKTGVNTQTAIAFLVLFLILSFGTPCILWGTQPVPRTLKGCVIEGNLFDIWRNEKTNKPVKAFLINVEGPIDLVPYEGKSISLEGYLLPGDHFAIKKGAIPVVIQDTCDADDFAVIKKEFILRYRIAGCSAARRDDFSEGLRWNNVALDMDKTLCGTYLDRALIYFLKGDSASGSADIKIITSKGCTDPDGLNFLVVEEIGAILRKTGRKAAAIELYKVGLKMCDSNDCRKAMRTAIKEARK